jgi:general secretion pathway protein K
MDSCYRQQGIALITVLLVLAIATVALVSMSTSRQLDIRRTENLMRSSQAFEHLYSLETWAKGILKQDATSNSVDSFEDIWAAPMTSSAPQGGQLSAHLLDLQGRFNLNNLIIDGKANDNEVKRFKRLLSLLKINPIIVDAVLDWLDADSDPRYPEGAEDETYLREQPPYRTGNRSFADVSELLLIKGISHDDYQKLLPYIYATEGIAAINVNTADVLVLQSLADQLTEENAEALVRAVKNQPFKKIEAFLTQKELAALGISDENLGVISQNFLLSGSIKIGKLDLQFASQLKRLPSGHTTLVKRQRRSPVNG